MNYKGYRFRRNKSIVTLPKDPDGSERLGFGRVCRPNTAGAVKTDWVRHGKSVWARPIASVLHERKNLMHGADGRIYLFHAGEVFVASMDVSSLASKNPRPIGGESRVA